MEVSDRIQIIQGDITAETVDAIVNAANTDLWLGSGVAGAIRIKGGSSIQEECNRHGAVELGGSALTSGGNLSARYVIHAAAMRLGEVPTADSIEKTVLNSLLIANQERMGTISFPALGTGVGGFSMLEAARIMIGVIVTFLNENEYPERVRFVLFDKSGYEVFKKAQDDFGFR
ncbi:MAG: macro domain-containing protein [Candidatus Hatepunaea meridiana]|nr:macro domain-containing protein [Candidatus Hatepunaea meridiana]